MPAPAVLTGRCVSWGWPGWLVVGLLFAGAGLVSVPVVRRAENRTVPGDPALDADPLSTR